MGKEHIYLYFHLYFNCHVSKGVAKYNVISFLHALKYEKCSIGHIFCNLINKLFLNDAYEDIIVIKLTCFILYQGQSTINFIAEHFTWIYHFNRSLISIVGEFLERRPLFVCCNNLYYLLMTQTTTNLLSSTQYLFKCNKCI